ncbi:MAG: hypothetical protein ACUVSX_06710 [Aggregatilineales bacterium]
MEETYRELMELPSLIIGAMMNVDGPGFLKGWREASAGLNYFDTALERFNDNAAVLRVLAYMEQELPGDIGAIDWDDVLARLDRIDTLLAGTPDAPGYKQFIYELAETVASASGAGLFGSGPKISEREAAFLAELRARLGL